MESNCSIKLLGIGSVSIKIDGIAYFIDSFNKFNIAPDLAKNDVVMFTHDDEDHFIAQPLIPKLSSTNIIIGPPNIAYPLLTSKKVDENQLRMCYPVDADVPIAIKINDLDITVFRTEHFLDWHAAHVSYLISNPHFKIYITGDSSLSAKYSGYVSNIDCMIVNLLKMEIVKGKMTRDKGKYFHVSELLQIQHDFRPRLLIGNHLINCNWAVDPEDLSAMIKANKLSGIVVPKSVNEEIILEECV